MRTLLLATTLLAAPAWAQSSSSDLATYQDLRARLTSEFLVPGTGPGTHVPMGWRHDGFQLAKWADGTVMLGWWLTVLATEHALLADPATFPGFDGGDTTALDRTRQQLGEALLAVRRLDDDAEASFFLTAVECLVAVPVRNGFLIRDDVPTSIAGSFSGITSVLSDRTDIVVTNREMSQDQAIHLLLGLTAVAELVPGGTTGAGLDLQATATAEAERIGTFVAAHDWRVTNPGCGDRDVARGADATGYAKGIAAIVSRVTGGAVNPSVGVASELAWTTLRSPLNPAYLNPDNLHMTMATAAAGRGWGGDTLEVLVDLSGPHDWTVYPLMHRVLGGGGPWSTLGPALTADAHAQLRGLPFGDEPRSHDGASPPGHGWASDHRWLREAEEQEASGGGSVGQRYHGLDWLALHNALYLADPTRWEPLTGAFTADPPAVCAGGSSVLTADDAAATAWSWTVDSVDAGQAASITVTPSGTDPVDVELTVSDGLVDVVGSATLDVVEPSPPTIRAPEAICPGERVEVCIDDDDATVDWPEGLAEIRDGCASGLLDGDTTLVLTGDDAGGCPWTIDVPIDTHPAAVPASLTVPDTLPVDTDLLVTADRDVFAWAVPGGTLVSSDLRSVTVRYDQPGSWAVVATVATPDGCTATSEASLQVGDGGTGDTDVEDPPARNSLDEGCGCQTTRGPAGLLAVLPLLGLVRARRRSRPTA